MKTFLSLTSLYFLRDLFLYSPIWVRFWIGLMMLALLIAPLFFFDHAAARWMAGSMVLGGMIMGWMHMKMGITRLMGLAHLPWLIPFWLIVADLRSDAFSGAYQVWLVAAAVIVALCLAIDVTDVIRYWRGDRTPIAPPAPV